MFVPAKAQTLQTYTPFNSTAEPSQMPGNISEPSSEINEMSKFWEWVILGLAVVLIFAFGELASSEP